jgi:hypothetical protein
MASESKVSKNSVKGSKSKVVEMVKKVRPKKEFILIELTPSVYTEIKATKELTEYQGKFIEDTIFRYGKTYLYCKNK